MLTSSCESSEAPAKNGAVALTEARPSRKRPFVIGLLVGIFGGLALGSTLAAIFGDDVSVLVHRLIKRIVGERDEPNFQILLQ
jgi:hypothetical protein